MSDLTTYQINLYQHQMKTHLVLDLHYTEDEGQDVFVGTHSECEDFASEQSPYFMYKVVPMSQEEIINYPDNK